MLAISAHIECLLIALALIAYIECLHKAHCICAASVCKKVIFYFYADPLWVFKFPLVLITCNVKHLCVPVSESVVLSISKL